MHKTTLTIVAALTLTAIGGTPLSTAAGPTCDDDAYGVGWEYPSCSFTCEPDSFSGVLSSQQDANYVDGWAECGDSIADCANDYGKCSDRDVFMASGESTTGDCNGSAYSGGTTDAHVYCDSGSGGSAVALIQKLLQQLLQEPIGASPAEDTCMALTAGGSHSGVLLSFQAGADLVGSTEEPPAQGLVFNSTGCWLFHPVCTMFETGLRECSLR